MEDGADDVPPLVTTRIQDRLKALWKWSAHLTCAESRPRAAVHRRAAARHGDLVMLGTKHLSCKYVAAVKRQRSAIGSPHRGPMVRCWRQTEGSPARIRPSFSIDYASGYMNAVVSKHIEENRDSDWMDRS